MMTLRTIFILLLLIFGKTRNMSRLLDDAANDLLRVESPAVIAYPFAMACWFNSDDDTSLQTLMFVGDKDVGTHYTALYVMMDSNNELLLFQHQYTGGAASSASSTTFATVNTWHHAAGILLSVSERHVYLDAGGKGSNAGVVGPMANHDRTTIGYTDDSSPQLLMSGHIAEVAFWDLTGWGANDAERETNFERALASLAAGFSPEFFRLGLVNYWRLTRNLHDKIRSYDLTATGTVVSPHPPGMIYPSKILTPMKQPAVVTPHRGGTGSRQIYGADRLRGLRRNALY